MLSLMWTEMTQVHRPVPTKLVFIRNKVLPFSITDDSRERRHMMSRSKVRMSGKRWFDMQHPPELELLRYYSITPATSSSCIDGCPMDICNIKIDCFLVTVSKPVVRRYSDGDISTEVRRGWRVYPVLDLSELLPAEKKKVTVPDDH